MRLNITAINLILTALSIIFGGLLVISVTNSWEVIDAFALPQFDDVHVYENMNYLEALKAFLLYSMDGMKASLLDFSISTFGYSVSAPFAVILGIILFFSIAYVVFGGKSKFSYVPILCCLISGLVYVSIKPTIILADIGASLSSKNHVLLSEFNYLDKLRNEHYGELDMQLENIEKQFESNAISEFEYINEYDGFESAGQSDLVYFDKWLVVTSNRYSALISRAIMYEELGWEARGAKFFSKTSEDEFSVMKKYFSKAVKDHEAALEIKKQSLLSYGALINMESAYDVGMEGDVLFDKGIQLFPTSYYLTNKYMFKHRPRWGGSYLEIRNAARKVRNQAINNPMLIVLGNKELIYRASVLEKNNEIKDAIRLRKFAFFYGATAKQIRHQEIYYDNKNDSVNAINTLTQGLALYPNNIRLLVSRAKYYAMTDEAELALADMATVDVDDIRYISICEDAAKVYSDLEQFEEAFKFYVRSIAIDPDKYDYAYNKIYWLSYNEVIPYSEALPYLKKWTEVFPENSDGWISYASTLAESNKKASVYPYEQFLKYADRESSVDVTAIKHVENVLQKIRQSN